MATKTVTVTVVADGVQVATMTQEIEDWAVDYVATAACAQVEDPDYEAAQETSAEESASEPPGSG